jgi:hypothetical protein
MATQLIRLPRYLMDALLQSDICDRRPATAGEHPEVRFERVGADGGETLIAVAIGDSTMAWDHWPLHGTSVFVLALTAAEQSSRDHLPRPLPDDLVGRTIEAITPVLCSLLRGGHDALDLAGLLDTARHLPNAIPVAPIPRAPRTRFERRLRETALRLQWQFAARLAPLHRTIAAHGDALLRSNLGPAIDSLSTQGAVADWLSLKHDGSLGGLRMAHDDPRARHDLLLQMRTAGAARKAMARVLGDLAPYAVRARWRFSPFHLAELYQVGFSQNLDRSIWRRDNPANSIFPYSVPAIGIEAAMKRFALAFDRRLLADIDPIVVAGLGFFQMMVIAPYGRSDSDVGRLLLQVLLRQADLPPTPMPLMLNRRYWEHATALDQALQRNDPGHLLASIVAAMEEAIVVGQTMIATLDQERARLLAALAEIGTGPRDAADVVSDLQSNMLARRWDPPENVPPDITSFEREMRHLHAKGLIDLVAAGGMTWWSSPVTRRVTAS